MSSLLEKSTKFVASHKSAIAVSVVAGASVAGALYYVSQNQGPTSEPTKKPTQSKKKKKSAPSSPKKQSSTKTASKVYPVDEATGLPKIDPAAVKDLSAEDKEKWANALKADGNEYFKNKEYNEAVVYYTAALDIKVDPVFYSNRSACYAGLGEHDKVIEDTTKALELKPGYVKPLLRRASTYEQLNRLPEAMFDYTTLTIFGGYDSKVLEASLESILKKHSENIVAEKLTSQPRELPSASSISSFFGAFNIEKSVAGIDVSVDELAEGSADKFLLQGLLNVSKFTAEGFEKADVDFNQAAERYHAKNLTSSDKNASKAAIALEYNGAFEFLKNDPVKAVECLEKAIALCPRPKSYVLLALLAADKADFDTAVSLFEHAKQINPNDPDVFYHLGQMHYLKNELDEAKADFEKAKSYNPENIYAYIQLACVAYKNSDNALTDSLFNEAKSKFPTSPEIPNYYGEILYDRGEIEKAVKQFDVSARLQEVLPTFSVGALPLINKAQALQQQQKLEECMIVLEKANQIDGKSELVKISLAQLRLQMDKPEEAVKLFEEAAEISRGYEEKLQATSFAEAAKIQIKVKQTPLLKKKIEEMMSAMMASQMAQGQL